MQNSARCVLPVRSVSRCRSARSVTQGRPRRRDSGRSASASSARRRVRLDLGEGDLHLVQVLRPALVETGRLARRADEAAREHVRQRRVALPPGQHAHQQVGPQQHRRGRPGCAPPRVMWLPPPVPEWRPSIANVSVAEALLGRERVERVGELAELGPAAGRVQVDLDDPGVGRHEQRGDPRVRRRPVALEHDAGARSSRPRARPGRRSRASARAARAAAGRRARSRRAPA